MAKKKEEVDSLEILRHSAAHLLAAAVQELYPKTKFGVGPVVENGFYYDMEVRDAEDKEVKLSEGDLNKIEKQMRRIKERSEKYVREEMDIKSAVKIFKKMGQDYKVELLKDLEKKGTTSVKEEAKEMGLKNGKVSLYTTGKFVDLCRGPHVASAKEIKAFKLQKIAGAYWRGSEKNKMLTRVYGLAFESETELEAHLKMLEEAERRDHRKLGEEMELFTFSADIGPGLVLWMPNGNLIKEELENWAKETEEKWGYVRVTTPIITKENLFYISEHLPHYKDSMYSPMDIDGEKYYLKPMNCPFHHTIFKNRKRSYRELPLRLAEYGWCHRYEDSGSLFGLMRVRGMQMNDAHIYCTKDQAVKEFVDVIKLHEYYYKMLGIKEYWMELALRNPDNKKYHGDDAMWKEAESLMREAMEKSGVPFIVQNDGAAFYGPKIDFQIKSAIGREFTASTNQIDLFMPKKFDLKYIDNEGKEQFVVCIHRAPLGTHERFIGFLIEHFAGAFPTWLHPTQVQIIPVGRDHIKPAEKLAEDLKKEGVRVLVDSADETVGYKIRKAEKFKVPYMLVIGDKEKDLKKLSVRERGKKETREISLVKFKESILEEIKERKNK
ncbi:MAG: threonine--tRNA ligase [Patescibacteria group bacterium]